MREPPLATCELNAVGLELVTTYPALPQRLPVRAEDGDRFLEAFRRPRRREPRMIQLESEGQRPIRRLK